MAVLTVEQDLSLNQSGLTSGLADMLVVEAGGRRILYALSRSENLLIELEIAPNSSLSIANSLALNGTFNAGSEPLLGHIALADGSSLLTLAGLAEADGQGVGLGVNGTLGAQTVLPGVGSLAAPQGVDLDGIVALITGRQGGGLDLFTDTGSGLGWTASLADTADSYLSDVTALVSFTLGAQTFVGTASAVEGGVNLARVTNAGLTQAGALGAAEFLPVGTPTDMAVVQRLGETHLILASSGTSSLTTIAVGPGGVPSLADHILDSDATAVQGVRALDTARFGSFVYIAAGGDEGGISLFTMLPGGRLVHLDTAPDDNVLSLERITSVETAISGSVLQIYGGSFLTPVVSRLSYDLSAQGTIAFADGQAGGAIGTALDDQVIGSDVGEALVGGAGDDILFDGAGIDTLTGELGEDLFVMTSDGVLDVVADFERGIDRLDLSAFDFLYEAGQLTLTTEIDGATLTHGQEAIRIYTSDGAPLTIGELTNDDILNVDRPPFLAIPQELLGGAGQDTLVGGFGDDTILGGASADRLTGIGGNDAIEGGSGADLIDGGTGDDTLRGQADNDTIVGASGSDLIFGDIGDDVIYGDDWSGA